MLTALLPGSLGSLVVVTRPPRQGTRRPGVREGQAAAAMTASGSKPFTNVAHTDRSTEFASAGTSDRTPTVNSVADTTSAATIGSSCALPRRRIATHVDPSVR